MSLSRCYSYMAVVVSVCLRSEFYYSEDTPELNTHGGLIPLNALHIHTSLLTFVIFILSCALVLRSSIRSLEAVSRKLESQILQIRRHRLCTVFRLAGHCVEASPVLWSCGCGLKDELQTDLLSVCCV